MTHTHVTYNFRYYCINYFVFVNYYIICRLKLVIVRRRMGCANIINTAAVTFFVFLRPSSWANRRGYYSKMLLYCKARIAKIIIFIIAQIAKELYYILYGRESPRFNYNMRRKSPYLYLNVVALITYRDYYTIITVFIAHNIIRSA